MRLRPGVPSPFGARAERGGVNFALPAPRAERVELCLFDRSGAETARLELPGSEGGVRHGWAAGLGPGTVYGYRVGGPGSDPERVLFDPWARAVGRVDPPLAAVAEESFDWDGDQPPRRPWDRTVIYELHVKGFTKRHPGVPAPLRGTYAGLGHAAALAHLKGLGVTAVELLPVFFHADERPLRGRGLVNYWGYSPIGFFAPDPRLAADPTPEGCSREFKRMVRSLHDAGIEVILDVVYNHTGEGGKDDPPLSLKGIDAAAYYRLDPADPSRFEDFTGCQNTLDARSPAVRRLVMDSLRYWVREMRVDGFRFDLAPVLGRGERGFDPAHPLVGGLAEDPELGGVKLIAEPWDPGPGGFQLGAFPAPWGEWNGKYRDALRRFWRGDPVTPEFATRLAGSSDLFRGPGRGPHAGINYAACHDGFTLRDAVSYSKKRNEANGEGNRDGESESFTFNCGHEGETEDPETLELRRRQIRNMLASTLLSRGVPMLLAGDEMGRTQLGNNNAYCQDNEVSWVDWDLDLWRSELLEFARSLLELRRESHVFEREGFWRGTEVGAGLKDVSWHGADGRELREEDWRACPRRLSARIAARPGDALLLLFNPDPEPAVFALPSAGRAPGWAPLLDTAHPLRRREDRLAESPYALAGRAMAVLRSLHLPGGER